MLKDVEWSEDGTYTPQGTHTPVEFFNEALKNSVLFDIQLGYFNSAAINVLSRSFATFIKNNGYMRMAINQIVSRRDKEAIEDGFNGGIDAPFDMTDWDSIHKGLDEYGDHFFHCLAYLIQEKRIEIQIIKPKETSGIAHTKRGQFTDTNGMTVGFSGSANFTLGGLFNNLENIEIFLSTSPDRSIQKKLENNKTLFSNIMSKKESGIEYLSVSDLEEAITTTYGHTEIEELLDVERQLINYRNEHKPTNSMVSEDIVTYEPSFPYPSGPREYQKTAFENWKNNGQKGLFAMATGTGKTITSLNCLLEIYKRKGYYKALILVPTVTLVEQWEKECRKFNFGNIIKVYSKNAQCHEDIERIWFQEKYKRYADSEISYIFISTYASFCRERVFNRLNKFDPQRLLLIADECHNMGSASLLKRMKSIVYFRRIGLSATPERQFDDRGNMKIRDFFGVKDKYTFEYNMEEAIKNGVLCKYLYFPHLIQLTPTEMDEYMELSVKISKFFNYKTSSFDSNDEILKRLLLARKRIIHKAKNKLMAFKEIIHQRFQENGNLKYTLVYVPEGNKPDYLQDEDDYDQFDTIADDSETDHLIDLYTKAVLEEDEHITVRKFVSGQQEREQILDDFASGRLHVLTSMKCLDEGIDVPRSELAIFCASTGNPRQFIQRRGRILRTHKDKYMAEIHDLVVAPAVNGNSASFKMEQSLVRNELLRVRDFAKLSENTSYSDIALREVMEHYGLNLYNNDYIL